MDSYQLCRRYLEESGGNLEYFDRELPRRREGSGLRFGQILFNALTLDDSKRLIGTTYDPFFSDEPAVSALAVNFLTEGE